MERCYIFYVDAQRVWLLGIIINIRYNHSSAEEYLKKVISIPLLDNLIMEMKERFNKNILYISFGALLIPKVMNENKDSWKENILYKVI